MAIKLKKRFSRVWMWVSIVAGLVLIGGAVLAYYISTGQLKFFAAVTEPQVKECLVKENADCEVPSGLNVLLTSKGNQPQYYPAQDKFLGKLTINGTLYIRGRVVLQAREILVNQKGIINAEGGRGGDGYEVKLGDNRDQTHVWGNSGGNGGDGGGGGGGGGRGPRNRQYGQGACSTWESWTLKAYRNLSDLNGSEHFKPHTGGSGGNPGEAGKDGNQVSDWYPPDMPSIWYPWGRPAHTSDAHVGWGGKGWGYKGPTGATGAAGGHSEDLGIEYVGYKGDTAKTGAYAVGVTLLFVPGGAVAGITVLGVTAVVDLFDRINHNRWNIEINLYDRYNVRGAYQGKGGAGASVSGVGAGGQGGAGNGCDNLALDNDVAGGGGGGGGGSSVELHAQDSLVIAGKVTANGGKGGNGQKVAGRGYPSGAGGGGGGGSIDLILDNPNKDIEISGTVSANGGQGGVPGDGLGLGNGGGGGYITYKSSAIKEQKKYIGEAKLGGATLYAMGGQVDAGQMVEIQFAQDTKLPDGTVVKAGTKVKVPTATRPGEPGTIEVIPGAVAPPGGDGDINGDGNVDYIDLQLAIDRTVIDCDRWDTDEHKRQCRLADLNSSGHVDREDLDAILRKITR
jgi:hypothetical protein